MGKICEVGKNLNWEKSVTQNIFGTGKKFVKWKKV